MPFVIPTTFVSGETNRGVADYTIHEGDTAPLLSQALVQDDGSIVDLTGATVQFVLRDLTEQSPQVLQGSVSLGDPSNGVVIYTPTAADTAVGSAGDYMGQWSVTFPGGAQMTFPRDGYLWVTIESAIGSAPRELVGLPDVKDYLDISRSKHTHDAKLMNLIRAIRPVIEQITGPIIPQTFDEKYSGGNNVISLSHRPSNGYGTSPILNVSACSEYVGPTEYPLSLVANASLGTIYSFEVNARLGTITRRTSGGGSVAFPAGENSVHVIYESGQSAVPENVREAAMELARVNYYNPQATGRGSLSIADAEDEQQGPLKIGIPYFVRQMLAPTRRAPSIA